MTLVIGALTIGLILSVLALGVYISFRIFDFPDITAEGSTPGDPRLKAGLVVTVSTGQKHYDGKYLITRVRHWYRRKSKRAYTTDFYVQRDATDQSAGGSQNQS